MSQPLHEYIIYYTLDKNPEIFRISIRAGSSFGAWNKFKKSWLRDNPNTKNNVHYAGVKMIIE